MTTDNGPTAQIDYETPDSHPSMVWVNPPGWPPVPSDWSPPSGWQPNAEWPAAPFAWPFWIPRQDAAEPQDLPQQDSEQIVTAAESEPAQDHQVNSANRQAGPGGRSQGLNQSELVPAQAAPASPDVVSYVQPPGDNWQWNNPPGWPDHPQGLTRWNAGWSPRPDWKPEPAWRQAPDGWVFWVPQEGARGHVVTRIDADAQPSAVAHRSMAMEHERRVRIGTGIVVAVLALVGIVVAVSSNGGGATQNFAFSYPASAVHDLTYGYCQNAAHPRCVCVANWFQNNVSYDRYLVDLRDLQIGATPDDLRTADVSCP
jgi:hypothetical protein